MQCPPVPRLPFPKIARCYFIVREVYIKNYCFIFRFILVLPQQVYCRVNYSKCIYFFCLCENATSESLQAQEKVILHIACACISFFFCKVGKQYICLLARLTDHSLSIIVQQSTVFYGEMYGVTEVNDHFWCSNLYCSEWRTTKWSSHEEAKQPNLITGKYLEMATIAIESQ